MASRLQRDATRRVLAAGLAALIVTGSLMGCGEQGGGGSDADSIVEVTKQLAASAKAGDWESACHAMSARARAEFAALSDAGVGGKGCAQVIARVAAADDSPEILGKVDGEDVKVSNVRISGDRATADLEPTFEGPTAHYVREDGGWKLDR